LSWRGGEKKEIGEKKRGEEGASSFHCSAAPEKREKKKKVWKGGVRKSLSNFNCLRLRFFGGGRGGKKGGKKKKEHRERPFDPTFNGGRGERKRAREKCFSRTQHQQRREKEKEGKGGLRKKEGGPLQLSNLPGGQKGKKKRGKGKERKRRQRILNTATA